MLNVSCAGAVRTVHHPDCSNALFGRSEMMKIPIDGTSQKIAIAASTTLMTIRDGRKPRRCRFAAGAATGVAAGNDAACTLIRESS